MNVRQLLVTGTALLSVACADQRTPFAPDLVGIQPSQIISGVPDQGQHPYVGLIVFDDANGPAWLCTGSLLSSTVVLTAGHCTDGAVAARIWMNEVVQGNAEFPFGGVTSYEGTPHTHPDFCVLCGNGFGLLDLLQADVGIVVLSEPVPTSVVANYVQLPPVGLVSTIANGATIQLVGYGVQVFLVGGGPPLPAGVLRRLTTPATFLSGSFHNSELLVRLSGTSSRGRGSACFGDSGGPNLVGSSHVTMAINSYGTNRMCAGVGYSTRIDRPEILSWINGFLD